MSDATVVAVVSTTELTELAEFLDCPFRYLRARFIHTGGDGPLTAIGWAKK